MEHLRDLHTHPGEMVGNRDVLYGIVRYAILSCVPEEVFLQNIYIYSFGGTLSPV